LKQIVIGQNLYRIPCGSVVLAVLLVAAPVAPLAGVLLI
jgi:hypothetical protein